jgi:hypothetical protein
MFLTGEVGGGGSYQQQQGNFLSHASGVRRNLGELAVMKIVTQRGQERLPPPPPNYKLVMVVVVGWGLCPLLFEIITCSLA